jgi:hypothetical protein
LCQKSPKFAKFQAILGAFLSGNKDSNPCLEDPDFLSHAKKGQRVGSLNPGSVTTLNESVILCIIFVAL